MKNNIVRKTLTMLLAFAMVFTMMPMLGIGVQKAHAATAPGGMVASNNAVNLDSVKGNTVAAETAFGSSNVTASYNIANKTLTITLYEDITLSSPVRFVKGSDGDKIVLNLNNHTITGRAGVDGTDTAAAIGGNAIEIAADEFDVEIMGPGSVIGGKGDKLDRPEYNDYRVGTHGGSAVYFCERVDKVHGTSGTYGDILDEGYHPDKLERGLTVTGGASLVGGAGADLGLADWKHNLAIGYFGIVAGRGGNAIDQVFSGTGTADVFEELSYAKIVIADGSVTGGAGGNVDLGDQLLTTADIQKISEIQQFMQGKDAGYDFDSNVMGGISFVPANGGDGIDFHAGRKYIEVGSGASVTGGTGGRFICSEKASMVKSIETECGDGGTGILVSGDTGLTSTEPSLTASNWNGKTSKSDDVGIYIAGTVTGGKSPSTTLLSDASGNGGKGIDNDLDGGKLCQPYSVYNGHNPTFDVDRGITLVASDGKVIGGASGAADETTINGGSGADAMDGGSTGSPNGGTSMSAAYFVINGELKGGYGSKQGGNGFYMEEEQEYLDQTGTSAYFGAILYGSGSMRGGASGEWPYIGAGYTADSDRVIKDSDGSKICGEGIKLAFGSHEGATTIGSQISSSDGAPAKLMKTNGTFKVTPTMTAFVTGTAPTSAAKLSADVTKPTGYSGKVYITWSAEYETSTPRIIRRIEGANGAYNNISILGVSDYPYGWKQESYGWTSTINVATLDHIAERVGYNATVHIYCHALLEDGRFVDNEDIWFSKYDRSPKGWGGSGGGEDPGQDDIDAEAALNVTQLIDKIPATVTLDDADTVNTAWDAYQALNDNAKSKVWPANVEKLQNAKARIDELNGGTVNSIVEDINKLAPAENITAETALQVKAAIDEIYGKINNLSDEQKAVLATNTETLQKLKAVEDKVNELVSGGTHTHLMQHIPAKAATCSTEGNTEYYKCMTCEKYFRDAAGSTEITDPSSVITQRNNNHRYGAWRTVTAPTCTSAGTKECVCEYNNAHRKTAEIPIDPDAHAWDAGVVTKQPAVGVTGTRTYTCTGCGAERTETIDALPQPYAAPSAPAAPAEIQDLPAVKISKPKAAKGKLTVKWKKVSKKNQKKIQGIEIRVAGSGVDKVVTAGKKKTSKKVGGLQRKTKYTVQVRAYAYRDGVKHVSAWKSKSGKTK